MLQSLLQMQCPLQVFERNCSPLHRIFIPTATQDFLTNSEWDTILSFLKVISPLEIATRVLSSVNYPSLGFTFIVFHQILQNLDDFLTSSLIS
jgi:hypothetical protein